MSLPDPQTRAADPAASVFLTANAGSGKTSTLVNRVARLLLNGAQPEHILCVTYTRAAAAEMQSRLYERLGGWAVADDETLRAELRRIGEADRDVERARTLFARALETPGGLKIQTLHSFCERLLRRFPLEAHLSPAFDILDDLTTQSLSRRAMDDLLLLEAESLADGRAARDRLILKLKPFGFQRLLGQFRHQHDRINEAVSRLMSSEDWRDTLYRRLELEGVITRDEALRDFEQGLDVTALRETALSLGATGKATDLKAADYLAEVIADIEGHRPLNTDALMPVFLTGKGEPRKSFYTKGVDASCARFLDELGRRVIGLVETLKAIAMAELTGDALRVFALYSHLYGTHKRESGALDFADLVRLSGDLLSGPMSPWVLYKLDGGLEHVLVDEAQDTSAEQWQIVRALSGDFFSGEGVSRRRRTVFAVGDEKQSIYGFQGARPELFLENRQYFTALAAQSGQDLAVPELKTSYRTLPGVLEAVDAVFDGPDLSFALNFTGEVIEHIAHRTDHPGLVELWPRVQPIAAPDADDEGDDDIIDAVDRPASGHAALRLARQIAREVARAITEGQAVFDKPEGRWRPVHAGDVLILVRKRDLLFEHLIRELKLAGVAVSGADKLKLGDHIAFADLRALMRVCLQPDDSLSLAAVLRSPMCDLSEDDLFTLSREDASTLWRALWRFPEAQGPFASARAFIDWAIQSASKLTAFDFLSRVLNRRDPAGRSLRQRFVTRLGAECEDVLDETLNLARTAEAAGEAGLIETLDIFEYNASEIKREQEEAARAVRVMTVHGSKGLEAPWVILPIAPNFRSAQHTDLLLIGREGELALATDGTRGDTALSRRLKATKAEEDDQESLRLLYVALTRARDRLTICGYKGRRAEPAATLPGWYDLVATAFETRSTQSRSMALVEPFDETDMIEVAAVRILGSLPPPMSAEAAKIAERTVLPAFVSAPVPQEDVESERWASISQLGDEDRDREERNPSPLSETSGLGRFRRGELIHKLFEILPDQEAGRRPEILARYLARQPDLNEDQRQEIAGAVMGVLNDERFNEAFGPGSRAEVALAGTLGRSRRGETLRLSGRIDRLVVSDDRVLIIDYKSNRPAPDRAEDAAIDYQRQMAGYVALLRKVHPDKQVEAALLWTDGPKLTPLNEGLIELRLSEILAR